jgi:hypothetical protein
MRAREISKLVKSSGSAHVLVGNIPAFDVGVDESFVSLLDHTGYLFESEEGGDMRSSRFYIGFFRYIVGLFWRIIGLVSNTFFEQSRAHDAIAKLLSLD